MLKVKFWRIENVVCMKVLEQDESTRGTRRLYHKDGFEIMSVGEPEIAIDTLYVRGDVRSKDNRVASRSFADEEKAKKYITTATKAIAIYNKGSTKCDECDVAVTIAE